MILDKYLGVSTEDRTAHLFVSGTSTWDSAGYLDIGQIATKRIC